MKKINATPSQVLAAIASLTQDEWDMLLRGAAKRIDGSDYSEPLDLVNEALDKLLSGARKWPLDIGFGPCVQKCMRSIANSDRRHARKAPGARVDIDDAARLGLDALAFATPAVDEALSAAQQQWMVREAARQARGELALDPDAAAALGALLEGIPSALAREDLGLGALQYEYARRRAMRALRRCAEPIFEIQ